MSNPEISETLKEQGKPIHPLVMVLLGLVARCDYTNMVFTDALIGDPLPDCLLETQSFIEELGVRGLYKGMVLKMQLPIHTNAEVPFVLAYNQDKSLLEELTIDDSLLAYFPKGEYKVYVFARVWVTGVVQVVKPVPAEDW